MKQQIGNLWHGPYAGRVVPTNAIWNWKDGHPQAVMGAGVALQAAKRHNILPILLGYALRDFGNHVFSFDIEFNHQTGYGDPEEQEYILTFPTKNHYRENADPALIEQSAMELAIVVRALGLHNVVLPQVGCGLGGLTWHDVSPILEKYLDDRFTVVVPKATA